jgi:hypothetical protein
MMERKLKVFISGPMTGYDNLNAVMFSMAEERFKRAGYEVVNPVHLYDINNIPPYEECVKISLRVLIDCDAIALLPNWQRSKGAVKEAGLARILDLKVFLALDMIEVGPTILPLMVV